MSKETDFVIENIIRIRKEKKISIVKLSADSGVSRSHLFYIETKKTSPSLDTLDRIAKSLGVNMENFFNSGAKYKIVDFSSDNLMVAEGGGKYGK